MVVQVNGVDFVEWYAVRGLRHAGKTAQHFFVITLAAGRTPRTHRYA